MGCGASKGGSNNNNNKQKQKGKPVAAHSQEETGPAAADCSDDDDDDEKKKKDAAAAEDSMSTLAPVSRAATTAAPATTATASPPPSGPMGKSGGGGGGGGGGAASAGTSPVVSGPVRTLPASLPPLDHTSRSQFAALDVAGGSGGMPRPAFFQHSSIDAVLLSSPGKPRPLPAGRLADDFALPPPGQGSKGGRRGRLAPLKA